MKSIAHALDDSEFVHFAHARRHIFSWRGPCFIIVARICSNQGPVVQSVVSLTSSLRVISLTVLADSVYNILIMFAEKM